MTNATKLALEESLKHLLLKKPLDKITINDLTTDCGMPPASPPITEITFSFTPNI